MQMLFVPDNDLICAKGVIDNGSGGFFPFFKVFFFFIFYSSIFHMTVCSTYITNSRLCKTV